MDRPEDQHAPRGDISVHPPDESGGAWVVRLSGELDLDSVQQFEAQIDEVLRQRPKRLIVDASELSFADSSAITLWVRWASAVEHFELRDPPPLVRSVLARMGLSDKLGITP